MGLIRFFLALSVLIYHGKPIFGIKLLDGPTAVQSFFIISGFYMTLLLNSSNIKPKEFYIRRYLRLWPAYFVVFAISALILRLPDPSSLTTSYKAFLLFSNIFILGQGLSFFIDRPTGKFYPVLQAWTMGWELLFYLIAPFILRVKNKAFVFLTVFLLSFTLRLYLYSIGLYNDPWDHRFFFTEIALFMTGALAYLLYEKIINMVKSKKVGYVLVAAIITMMFIMPLLNIHKLYHFNMNSWLFYLSLTFSLPFIFLVYKDNKFDRWIGELSYPIYLVHFFVMRELGHWHILRSHIALYVPIVTILLSILLVKYVQEPVDRFRKTITMPV